MWSSLGLLLRDTTSSTIQVIEVFIGWGGRAGIPVAVALGEYLDSLASFRCFVARDISPGLPELEEIVASIKGSDAAVMVVTNGTARHKRWRDELSYLYRCGVPILPFVANGAPVPSLLDYLGIQRMRFDLTSPVSKFSAVAKAIPVLVDSRRRI